MMYPKKIIFYLYIMGLLSACEHNASSSVGDELELDSGVASTSGDMLTGQEAGQEAGQESGQEAGQEAGEEAGQEAGELIEDFGVSQNEDMGIITSLSLSLDSPIEGMSYTTDDDIVVRGSIVIEGSSLDYVAVEAIYDEVESLPLLFDRETGLLMIHISQPTPGEHSIRVTAAMAPEHREEVSRQFTVSCPMVNDFDEALDPTMWLSKGPAIRDERGWLELTQNQLNTQGAIFWAGSPVRAGDLDIEFTFSTSKCTEPGACEMNRINAGGGFSINFWDVRPQELDSLWAATSGLGNVTPTVKLAEEGRTRADSFHIVFDTYSNTCTPCGVDSDYDGCGNRHEEPSTVNHVSLLFNGHQAIHGEPDDSGSYCHLGPVGDEFNDRWTAFPELDDGRWHQAHLTIVGTRIQLRINEQDLIDAELPNLRFKGGILSIAAGSGVNGNFHRVDRLKINEQCY